MLNNSVLSIFIYIFLGIFILFLLGGLILFLAAFLQELRYLNKEIQCTRGEERKYWIRERRRLWLSLLPFVKY